MLQWFTINFSSQCEGRTVGRMHNKQHARMTMAISMYSNLCSCVSQNDIDLKELSCRSFRKASVAVTKKALRSRHRHLLQMLSAPNDGNVEKQANFFVHMVLACMEDVQMLRQV
jgi:hypothetical protein